MELLTAIKIIGICAALTAASIGWDYLRSLTMKKYDHHSRIYNEWWRKG